MPPLSGSWANALKGEFSKDYYKKLFQTVKYDGKRACRRNRPGGQGRTGVPCNYPLRAKMLV